MSESEPSNDDRHPWKEAVLIGSAMLFTAVVTLTYAVNLLNSTDIVQKSRRVVPARPQQAKLAVPEVQTFTPDDREQREPDRRQKGSGQILDAPASGSSD